MSNIDTNVSGLVDAVDEGTRKNLLENIYGRYRATASSGSVHTYCTENFLAALGRIYSDLLLKGNVVTLSIAGGVLAASVSGGLTLEIERLP